MGLAVVTGGSRGLGYETARALKEAGHEVVFVAKDPERLAVSSKILGCEFRAVDLADIDSARATFTRDSGYLRNATDSHPGSRCDE
jgi:NAD(P)-dependent dehydrogenase (short-subunit alcohol dehydrogenase family)